ncbi:hypothetical protein HMPREF3227_01355 [Corynebacterium sp. CMW7794]|nr:hypothetical protein HMPREF3227_01355 [Corynebacterium sp. CMW7794]
MSTMRPATWAGSSPLTRGAPVVDNTNSAVRGLIPAHAGSTSAQDCRWAVYGAHPRSRGEHASR